MSVLKGHAQCVCVPGLAYKDTLPLHLALPPLVGSEAFHHDSPSNALQVFVCFCVGPFVLWVLGPDLRTLCGTNFVQVFCCLSCADSQPLLYTQAGPHRLWWVRVCLFVPAWGFQKRLCLYPSLWLQLVCGTNSHFLRSLVFS